MSIRLAVHQHETRPLGGLCAELQSAGYQVLERCSASAFLELAVEREVDALLLEVRAKETASLLDELKAGPERNGPPIMLIAEGAPEALGPLAACRDVDDIIILPILRDELRSRVRNISRLATMTAELERRRKALADFEIKDHRQPPYAGQAGADRARVLLIGQVGEQQVSLIDLLGDSATFAHATTMDQAWRQLEESPADLAIITSKTAPDDIRELRRRIRTMTDLVDLPLALANGSDKTPDMDAVCRDEGIDVIRLPFSPIAMKKRLEMMVRQYRLRGKLRCLPLKETTAPTVDYLTGLHGRGFLHHYLEQRIEDSRARGAPLSVASCKIDGLANVNGMLGYPVGDQMVGELGRALLKSCRAEDLVARSGGSSFCIVLGDTSAVGAHAVCDRVTGILGDLARRSGQNRLSHLRLTIGLAELTPVDTAESLVKRALQHPSVAALRQAS